MGFLRNFLMRRLRSCESVKESGVAYKRQWRPNVSGSANFDTKVAKRSRGKDIRTTGGVEIEGDIVVVDRGKEGEGGLVRHPGIPLNAIDTTAVPVLPAIIEQDMAGVIMKAKGMDMDLRSDEVQAIANRIQTMFVF